MAVDRTFEVFSQDEYADAVAAKIAQSLAPGPVMITGGETAGAVYRALAALDIDWEGHQILFSDERAVPPEDADSNYRMAAETLIEPAGIEDVLRIRGEDDPEAAARAYEEAIGPALKQGLALQILGMGDDCHIAALFPGSPALRETERLAVAVDRPDGLRGITLTPPALQEAKQTFVIVTGAGKAKAVARAVRSDEPADACPVHLLIDPHFLVDEAAASAL